MIEVRRDLELPTVRDGDPQVVPKLAEALLNFVGGDIPGIGIDHTNVYMQSMGPSQAHMYHQNLVLQAAEIVRPELSIDTGFRDYGGLRGQPHLPFHADRPCRISDDDVANSPSGLPVYLRLHTADARNGAEVMLANGRPGVNYLTARDYSLFRLPADWRRMAVDGLGYDPTIHRSGVRISEEVVTGASAGATGIDGTRSDGDIYHYSQHPLYSVLFRSRAALGPASLHGFNSFDPMQERTFSISNINAYSQPIAKRSELVAATM